MFKIVDEASGDGVGSVGYWEKDWRDEHVYETGWSVLPEFQGRGIAGERDRAGDRARPRRGQAPLHARLPERRQRAVERDLPQARLRAARGVRLRVPEGGTVLPCNDWRLDLRLPGR